MYFYYVKLSKLYLSCMLILCMMSCGSFIVSCYLPLFFLKLSIFTVIVNMPVILRLTFLEKRFTARLFNKLFFRVAAVTVQNEVFLKKVMVDSFL